MSPSYIPLYITYCRNDMNIVLPSNFSSLWQESLASLLSSGQPGDDLMFYYSGHGTQSAPSIVKPVLCRLIWRCLVLEVDIPVSWLMLDGRSSCLARTSSYAYCPAPCALDHIALTRASCAHFVQAQTPIPRTPTMRASKTKRLCPPTSILYVVFISGNMGCIWG